MMTKQIRALQAELIKLRNSNILWVTFVAFGLAPLMGGIFILIVQDSDALEKAGSLAVKAQAMNFKANWSSYFEILTQAVGVGGVLVFGFVASWIFGREYSDGTSKDLLSLPVSRTMILNAKFIVYILWCFILAISNLVIAYILGTVLQLPALESGVFSSSLTIYFITTVLTIIIGIPIAFFALYGKGYLAPLGFVALTLVFAQVIAATGYGSYFPWSIPGLYSGAGGDHRIMLDNFSYIILIFTGIAGYLATVIYWNTADQAK